MNNDDNIKSALYTYILEAYRDVTYSKSSYNFSQKNSYKIVQYLVTTILYDSH